MSFFQDGGAVTVPAGESNVAALFESIEPGSGEKLRIFLKEAEYKYRVGMQNLVYKPNLSLWEFADMDLLRSSFKIDMLSSFSRHVRKYFKDPKILQLLEFPLLFLGARPTEIPALFSLMNYADISLGTWYPMGGMYEVVKAMETVARSLGVAFKFESQAEEIVIESERVAGVKVSGDIFDADFVVGAGDYHHMEQDLLEPKFRTYSKKYWDSRKLAPSCLIFYVGLDRKIQHLHHHNLFFDTDFARHADEIYGNPQWPKDPLFYVCCPSKTDRTVAPEGQENLFILIPIAVNLPESEALEDHYFDLVIKRIEKRTGEPIAENIIFKRAYSGAAFFNDYNAYKGNAYGLSNTLMQTGMLRPSIKSKKVDNLFFAGQLTIPGPGVPPAIISGQIVADYISNKCKKRKYEGAI